MEEFVRPIPSDGFRRGVRPQVLLADDLESGPDRRRRAKQLAGERERLVEDGVPFGREHEIMQKRVLERDGGLCQTPGCSRAAVHAHHVDYRSRGGSDCEANMTSLCAAHHLHGVHRGYIRVTGEAPGALAWSFPTLESVRSRATRPGQTATWI